MMKTIDIARMAVHNLWHRRMRTALNLVGVVTGCVVLLQTAAGGAGVRDAIQQLFDSSELTRMIYIYPGQRKYEEPPEGTIVVEGDMSDERRERIREILVAEWKYKHSEPGKSRLSVDDVEAMRRLPFVQDVQPEIGIECSIQTAAEPIATRFGAADLHSQRARDTVIAGQMLAEDDRHGILVSEFVAYQLGYRSDADLDHMVGQTIKFDYSLSRPELSGIFYWLTESWGDQSAELKQQQAMFLQAATQLVNDLDRTSLSAEQKESIRSLLGQGQASTSDETTATNDGRPLTAMRQFVVRGIVRADARGGTESLFQRYFHTNRAPLQIHPEVAAEFYLQLPQVDSFHNAIVTVDSSKHLKEVTESIGEMGYYAESSLYFMENIDWQINQSMWVVYGIALAILITSGIGISNTLIMSVMERTPEFGIMKSLGARDSHLVKLMLCEAVLLGATGALIALSVSFLLAVSGKWLLLKYVEAQMRAELPGNMFQFSLQSILIVSAIAIVICTVASILPAWRAARLDPVVAMRRT